MGAIDWNRQGRGALGAGWPERRSEASPPARIAVLTGSERLFAYVSACFEREPSTCEHFRDEVALVRALKAGAVDLVLIDIDGSRHEAGPAVAWFDCHASCPVPVLALGRFADRDTMLGLLDSGVTDLVLGPIDRDELYLRAHLALKRSGRGGAARGEPGVLSVGPYRLDRSRNEVSLDGQAITVTAREFALAWLFFSKPNTMFNRSQIACSVWGNEADIVDRTLEQHIYKLRKKLRLGDATGVRLRTCYSLGYKLEVAQRGDTADRPEAAPVAAEATFAGAPATAVSWRPVASVGVRNRGASMAR